MALTAISATDGCPQCASALALRDGLGPVCNLASDKTEEEGMEETDKNMKSGSKKKDKKGQKSAENQANCSPRKQCQKLWSQMRKKLWGIVESKYFNRGIMIAILINTISMGIEHHDQVWISLINYLVSYIEQYTNSNLIFKDTYGAVLGLVHFFNH